jgi:hypothetical protein
MVTDGKQLLFRESLRGSSVGSVGSDGVGGGASDFGAGVGFGAAGAGASFTC